MITAAKNYLRFLSRCARIAFVGDPDGNPVELIQR